MADSLSNRPSPSGARISGDDYQHLYTWMSALELLLEDSPVTKVEFEVQAGNVDDLVVHHSVGSTVYNQIKFAMSQRQPLSHEWFTNPSRPGSRTPLQRFYSSWLSLESNGCPPEMALQTNRSPAPGDPILKHTSGRTGKVVPRLAQEGPKSDSGRVRTEWAGHIGICEDELLQMLANLEIRTGRASLEQLRDQCTWVMRAVGLRGDPGAVDIGVSEIRRLVGEGVRELDADSLRDIAETKNLMAGTSRATLLIQSLEADPWPEAAISAVYWVDLFEGSDAFSRRQLVNPETWNTRLKEELRAAVDEIKRQRYREVLVAGTMRLSTGLAVGLELSEVGGFQIAILGREGEWSSAGARSPMELLREEIPLGAGNEIALAVSISADIREDVLHFLRCRGTPVDKLIVYSPVAGASRSSIPGVAEGLGLAHEVSAAMRADTRDLGSRVHLFQAGPLPLSVILGHLWNRMPSTQLYDDMGPGRGYAPTFLLHR